MTIVEKIKDRENGSKEKLISEPEFRGIWLDF